MSMKPKPAPQFAAPVTIVAQCMAVLSDGTPRTVTELAREVAKKFGRSEKTVTATIYSEVRHDPEVTVSDGRPKKLSIAAAA